MRSSDAFALGKGKAHAHYQCKREYDGQYDAVAERKERCQTATEGARDEGGQRERDHADEQRGAERVAIPALDKQREDNPPEGDDGDVGYNSADDRTR